MQDQVSKAALADVGLGAIAKAGRRNESSGWSAVGVGRASRRQLNVEGLGRVVANVFRQEIDEAVRISIDPNRLLQFFVRHPYQLDIADVLLGNYATHCLRIKDKRNAALDADVAVKAPPANQPVNQAVRAVQERLAFTEGQLVNKVRLETMSDVEWRHAFLQPKISQSSRLIEHRRTTGVGIRQGLAKSVTRLD